MLSTQFTSRQPGGSREPVTVSTISAIIHAFAYLQLDLSLGDVCLATATAGNLLGLGNLIPDSLSQYQYRILKLETSCLPRR